MPEALSCRFCDAALARTFVDLGMSPLSNAYLEAEDLMRMEPFYPLRAFICERCLLVQLGEFASPEEIFGSYAYFSSYSDSWVRHAAAYATEMVGRFGLGPHSRVVEVASNDGYLLRSFQQAGIPVLGVEPARNVAEAAEAAGVPTLVRFFGRATAEDLVREGRCADLLVGNNVLAHVPDLNDFVAGLRIALAPQGIITMEFPHLLRLLTDTLFDTIYHEHFSYFSFGTVTQVFEAHELTIFDVEELPTHGGSLRIFARHAADTGRAVEDRVTALREKERAAGMEELQAYLGFGESVRRLKRDLLSFLVDLKREGKSIAAYGAPAKGNTLLNYCGIGPDFIDFTVDRNPMKSGRFLPGSHIPIRCPESLREARPDYVFILPWNLKAEIMEQMSDVPGWGGRFFVAFPEVGVCG